MVRNPAAMADTTPAPGEFEFRPQPGEKSALEGLADYRRQNDWQKMADENPPPGTPPPAKPEPTAADLAASGKSAEEIKALQKKVSTLEDDKQGLLTRLGTLETTLGSLKKIPSAKPGKSILDELDDFLGFGEAAPPTTSTTPAAAKPN